MKHAFILIALLLPSISSATEVSDFINKHNCDQVLDKGYYQICYDYSMKGAKYVGYTLDGVYYGEVSHPLRFKVATYCG